MCGPAREGDVDINFGHLLYVILFYEIGYLIRYEIRVQELSVQLVHCPCSPYSPKDEAINQMFPQRQNFKCVLGI